MLGRDVLLFHGGHIAGGLLDVLVIVFMAHRNLCYNTSVLRFFREKLHRSSISRDPALVRHHDSQRCRCHLRPLVWIGYHQTGKIGRLYNYLVPLICARQSDWPAHLVRFRIYGYELSTPVRSGSTLHPRRRPGDTFRFFEVACGSRQPSSDLLRVHVFRGAVRELQRQPATPFGA